MGVNHHEKSVSERGAEIKNETQEKRPHELSRCVARIRNQEDGNLDQISPPWPVVVVKIPTIVQG